LGDLIGPSASSDFEETFSYCQKNNIELYRNPDLHMKVLWDSAQSAIVGSANITIRGLGINDRYNIEVATQISDLTLADEIFLNSVILSEKTEPVDITLMEKLRHQLQCCIPENTNDTDINSSFLTSTDSPSCFLISRLPRFHDVCSLYDQSLKPVDNDDYSRNAIIHDLAVFNVSPDMSLDEFYSTLKTRFINDAFIAAFLNEVTKAPIRRKHNRPSFGFTQSLDWFLANATDKTAPDRSQMKLITHTLFNWIDYLSEGNFTVERHNFAEVLFSNSVSEE
jgi:hypothetical protein